jgi:hypothetical protein
LKQKLTSKSHIIKLTQTAVLQAVVLVWQYYEKGKVLQTDRHIYELAGKGMRYNSYLRPRCVDCTYQPDTSNYGLENICFFTDVMALIVGLKLIRLFTLLRIMNETPQSCDCTRQCVKGLQAYCKY